jgi:hypothetical protein
MAIGSVNYPSPVTVNGFSCRNCSEVASAKKGIDPAHPQSGPHNRDAAVDSSRRDTDPVKIEALRRAAQDQAGPVLQYGAAGRIAAAIPTGSAFSLLA